MSSSEFSETSTPSQFNKDAMTTSVSKAPLSSSNENAMKTDHVYTSACDSNHNPHLEERLKPPDDTNSSGIVCSNSPIPNNHTPTVNGSVDRKICCQLDDGVAVSCLDGKNQERSESLPNHSSVNKYDSEIKVTAASVFSNSNVSMSASDVSSMMSPQSESSLVLDCDCDGTEQCEESLALKSDKCNGVDVEKLIDGLEKTSMQDISGTEEQDIVDGITYVVYASEKQMPDIMRLITKDLSEPYSIYTYRYFIHNWPKLCFLAMDGDICIGAIVCKLDLHKKMVRRGYIAMLAVDSAYRRRKLGSTLVTKAIKAMIRDDCDEVVLETEITNQAALRLYENLGFVRDKRLFRYYLNGVDALRLKLWLR